jgi:hypothetical protein
MAGSTRYWENIVFSPSEFVIKPGEYLEENGYTPHEGNNSETADVRYIKQIDENQIEIIFSSINFLDKDESSNARFINFKGSEDLIAAEIEGLELQIKKVESDKA